MCVCAAASEPQSLRGCGERPAGQHAPCPTRPGQAVRCSAVQCGAVRCSAVRCGAVQCSAVQCSAVQWQRWWAPLSQGPEKREGVQEGRDAKTLSEAQAGQRRGQRQRGRAPGRALVCTHGLSDPQLAADAAPCMQARCLPVGVMVMGWHANAGVYAAEGLQQQAEAAATARRGPSWLAAMAACAPCMAPPNYVEHGARTARMNAPL